jgi:hypothetical protein
MRLKVGGIGERRMVTWTRSICWRVYGDAVVDRSSVGWFTVLRGSEVDDGVGYCVVRAQWSRRIEAWRRVRKNGDWVTIGGWDIDEAEDKEERVVEGMYRELRWTVYGDVLGGGESCARQEREDVERVSNARSSQNGME